MRRNGEKLLIVNADDANLTPGINRAILKAHDEGIVSSTTFLINLPVSSMTVRSFQKRKKLGIGLHLNVTLGRPAAGPGRVPTLVDPQGCFRKRADQVSRLPSAGDLAREYEAQITLFRKCFSRMPTHLDTHHQLHDNPRFLHAVVRLARRWKLPMRRSGLWKEGDTPRGLVSSRTRLGDLSPEGFWRKEKLLKQLRNLRPGVSELMCHPGKADLRLRRLSSFTEGREAELKVFSDPGMRKYLEGFRVRLTHFGMWYNW